MNNNTNLKNLFAALQEEMRAKARTSEVLNHPADMGDNSEYSWINWFNAYLPKRYKAAKATVIDSCGNVSDQIDIVVYDEQYSYLAFRKDNILYIPAESVYAVFEIKQNLNKENMEYAGDKAESVRRLERTSAPIPHAGGKYEPKKPHRIIAGILTTDTQWAELFGEPFKRCLDRYGEDQQIDCGCVLQKGSFYYDYKERELKTSRQEESLVFFFLQLLSLLQKLATVPAIDYNAYMEVLEISQEKLTTE